MNYFTLKKITNGFIILIGSAYLISLIVYFTYSEYRYWGPYSFYINKKDQKYLTKYSRAQEEYVLYDLNYKSLGSLDKYKKKDKLNEFSRWTYSNIGYSGYFNNLTSQLASSCMRINFGNYGSQYKVLWYYLPNEHCFIGYSRSSKGVYGYIGLNGFSKKLKDVRIFKEFQYLEFFDLNALTIISDHKAYLIHFQTNKVIMLHSEVSEKLLSVRIEDKKKRYKLKEGRLHPLVVRTTKRLLRYSPEGILLSSVILPKEISEDEGFVYLYNGKHYIEYKKGNERLGFSTNVLEFSEDGKILWDFKYNEVGPVKNQYLKKYYYMYVPFSSRLLINILSRNYEVDPFLNSINPLRKPEVRKVGDINDSFWLSLLIILPCLIFTHSHLIKRTDSKIYLYAWMLVVLIFSVPGLITYLFFYRDTKTIICTHCGKDFLPIKGSCLICSKEIPAPEIDGKEIFNIV